MRDDWNPFWRSISNHWFTCYWRWTLLACSCSLPFLSTRNRKHSKPIWDMLTSCGERTGVIPLNILIYMILLPFTENHRMLMLHELTLIVHSLGYKSHILNDERSQPTSNHCFSGRYLKLCPCLDSWTLTLFLLVWQWKAWCFKISGSIFCQIRVTSYCNWTKIQHSS